MYLAGPVAGVVFYVVTDSIQVFIIADDAVMIVSLPVEVGDYFSGMYFTDSFVLVYHHPKGTGFPRRYPQPGGI